MKSYRDLVLSSKEPKFHNVLWIKPISRGVYKIYMYEGDGWTPLYGGDGSTGLNYRILKSLPDGYAIQLRDELDVKNLYPKTLTSNVYNNAGKNVDTLIAEINQAIENALSNVKKAIFVNQEGFERWSTDRAGLSFLMYNPSQSVGGYEAFIRQYSKATGPWDYKVIPLYKGDIVMNISSTGLSGEGDKEATMYYVEDIIQGPRHAELEAVVDTNTLNNAIEELRSSIEQSREVTIDGEIYQSENLRWRVKKCYVVEEENLNVFTPIYGRYYAVKRSDSTYLTEIRYYNKEDFESVDDYTPVNFEVGDVFVSLSTTNVDQTAEIPYLIILNDGETVTVEKLISYSQLESYLHIATSESAGLVKGGKDININNDGTMYFNETTVPRAAEFITLNEYIKLLSQNPSTLKNRFFYVLGQDYDYNHDGEISIADVTFISNLYNSYFNNVTEYSYLAKLLDFDGDGEVTDTISEIGGISYTDPNTPPPGDGYYVYDLDEGKWMGGDKYLTSLFLRDIILEQYTYTSVNKDDIFPGNIIWYDNDSIKHIFKAKHGYSYIDTLTNRIYWWDNYNTHSMTESVDIPFDIKITGIYFENNTLEKHDNWGVDKSPEEIRNAIKGNRNIRLIVPGNSVGLDSVLECTSTNIGWDNSFGMRFTDIITPGEEDTPNETNQVAVIELFYNNSWGCIGSISTFITPSNISMYTGKKIIGLTESQGAITSYATYSEILSDMNTQEVILQYNNKNYYFMPFRFDTGGVTYDAGRSMFFVNDIKYTASGAVDEYSVIAVGEVNGETFFTNCEL